jgi:alkaline phosphatase D
MQSYNIISVMIITILHTCMSVLIAQHDAHRDAVREIARGEYGEAMQRIEIVSRNPGALWRSLSNAYTRAGVTLHNEGEEYRRFVLPENNFVMSMLHSSDGDVEKAMAYAVAAVESGLPFERLVAGPRDAFASLYNTQEFSEWIAKESPLLIHGPMLGHVTDDAVSFWVRTTREAPVRVQVIESDGNNQKTWTAESLSFASSDYTAVIRIEGLAPNTKYAYNLFIDEELVSLHEATFLTYPLKGEPTQFHVVFGGGAGYVPEHERIWSTIRRREPLALLLLGDNVYIDDPEHRMTQRYCYYRRHSRPEWRSLVSGLGVYAIWDDHDFGLDDSHGGAEIENPPWKRQVWEVFTQNWNNPVYGGGKVQPGCWFDFHIGDVHFIMLDGRYYRESPGRHTPRVDNPSMLGSVQLNWLKKTLRESEGTFKILVSPVPWASGTKGGPPGGLDTWDGFSEEREIIFNYIHDHRIAGVVLLSADRHRTDARRIERSRGYDLYDFMSSILTNYHTHPLIQTPELIFGYNENNSFGMLHFNTMAEDPKLTFEIINIDDESIWSIDLNLSQLTD